MTGLIAVGLMTLVVGVSILPVPLMLARALRRRRRFAFDDDQRDDSELIELERRAPVLGRILREARIVGAALEGPIQAAADVRVSAPFARLQSMALTYVPDSWAADELRDFDTARADAVRTCCDWLEMARQLRPDDRQALEGTGVTLDGVEHLVVALAQGGAGPTVARGRMLALHERFRTLERGLVGGVVAGPYR